MSDHSRDVDALLEQHLPDLHAYLRARTGPHLRAHESISDLLQSTCREAIQNLDRVPELPDHEFRFWLLSLAERKLKKRARYWAAEKRNAEREAGELTDRDRNQLLESYAAFRSPSHDASLGDEIERIEFAMDALPDNQREVVLMHHVLGVSTREIAQTLDRTEVAVRQQLSRGLARLQRKLRKAEETQ